jgi:protein TonB
MSDAVLDRGIYFPSPMTDWYRERPFKVAFVASLLIHAVLIALVPGFRAVVIEPPKVLEVELMLPEQPQVQPMPLRKDVVPPAPVTTPTPPPRTVEEKLVRPEPRIEPRPETEMRQPDPEPPIPRAEIVPPQPRPELRPEPPPVARLEPPPVPALEPRLEPRQEPRTEVRPEPQPVPRAEPPPVQAAQPRMEPETRPVQPPAPPVVTATVPPAPVAVPSPAPSQPVAQNKELVDPSLLLTYGQSISREIKRYQKYPPVAQRKGWEGTAEVLLQIAPDGKVTGITLGKSSGRSILDEEALNMVRKASPLPQAPQNLRGRELTVTVPIVFKLQS